MVFDGKERAYEVAVEIGDSRVECSGAICTVMREKAQRQPGGPLLSRIG